MPTPLPNLDDRTFAELVAEARALIPSLCPDWTNHNPSDPGIAIVELLAWFTETLLYQLNEIPDQNIETFLGLLGGNKDEGETLDAAIHRTILNLRAQYRAVTPEDFEVLALHHWPRSPEATQLADFGQTDSIIRARAVSQRNLAAPELDTRRAEAAGHVSLVVVPGTADPLPIPTQEMKAALEQFLKPRCLLTTKHHVVGPNYLPVDLNVKIRLAPDAIPDLVMRNVYRAMDRWFDPRVGGPAGAGWPFGRNVYVSEINAELERISSVDFVEDVELLAPNHVARHQLEGDEVIGVRLDHHELVELRFKQLITYSVDGQSHEFDVVGIIEQWRLG